MISRIAGVIGTILLASIFLVIATPTYIIARIVKAVWK